MRADAPPPEAEVHQHTTVAVTLGGRTLATGIPVSAGRLAVQADQDVPERLDLTLPAEWEGATLDPTSPAAALGSDGHIVEVTTTLTAGTRVWALSMGRYLVTSWDVDGASVRVQAAGLLTRVHEHQAARPRVLSARSPAVGELMAILRADGLEPVVHPGVATSRTVPAGFEIGEDRGAALLALAAAIPAEVRQGWDGSIGIHPAPAGDGLLTPVMSWHDGVGGTIVTPQPSGSREDLYSHIVVPWSREVTTVDAEGTETTETVEGVVEQSVQHGRLAVGTFGRRTRRLAVDGIEYHAQAQAVAAVEVARAHLRVRTLEVEMAPDWRAEVGDPPAVTTRGVTSVGRVTGVEYPLTPRDGKMVATVGVPA